jgi:transposase
MVLDPQVRVAVLERELQWAQFTIQKRDVQIRLLEERLRQQRIQFLGPRSETLSNLQLELLTEQEPSTTCDEVEAEAKRGPLPAKKERKPHPGRRPLPADLPREEEVVLCREANCKSCGEQTAVIGYDESELLDCEPARWFVRVVKREKRACAKCSTVFMPELAPRIIEKGLASDRVVIDTVIAKYCDHLPLYRQEAMLEREAGVEISRATLDGWVMRVGELLAPPIYRPMRLRCRCNSTTRAVPIIRLTCGNTANRVAKRFSSFNWAEAAKAQRNFLASGKAFCKPTAIRPTTTSAAASWCAWAVGRMRGVSLWMR